MSKTILIVDDHQAISDMLSTYLLQNQMTPIIAHNGEEALLKWQRYEVSLILLDVMMPYVDGYAVLQTIRETSNVPIIMLTAKGEEGDKLMGLDYGADDYIVKPFSPKEVVARINAVLRRVVPEATTKPCPSKDFVTHSNLTINMTTYEVSLSNTSVSLTKKEIDMLYVLATHPNQVFSRDELLSLVWGYDYFGDIRTVDTHIKRLRSKLQSPSTSSWQIKTIWGVGYKFETTKENC